MKQIVIIDDDEKLGHLLIHTDQGRNKIQFKMIESNSEVKINIKQSYKIDSDFLDNLKK